MPLYEYECGACGVVFEELCRPDDKAPSCPACGAARTVRLPGCPSPLKTGAFPFKPGPVHPMAKKMGAGINACPSSASCGNCGQ